MAPQNAMPQRITFSDSSWHVPDQAQVGYIIGDGIGGDITPVVLDILNAAVEQAYHGKKKLLWQEIVVSEKAVTQGKELLPEEALKQISDLRIVLKGPLTTPIGGGHRSLNVTLRQKLDLYACVRPVRWFEGVPNPMKHPEKLNVVIFRENTEDVYTGIEWKEGSPEAEQLIDFLHKKMQVTVRKDSGLGIKPISITGTKRLVRAAIRYAIAQNRGSVTLVHKGNIMKYTEGAFMEWGYQVATEEFAGQVVLESDYTPESLGKIIVKDRLADAIFPQLLLRPEEYDVIAAPNLNGDYLSDAAAAQVGGLGMAPGANINYEIGIAVFEATHGTAPKYAGQDKANPGSLLLSGVMMLELMQWQEAADLIVAALTKTIQQKKVTYDLARQLENAKELSTSEFGKAVVENMGENA